jgi:hypothetical protein
MFVWKFGYTPYTPSPLTPKGGIKGGQLAEKKVDILTRISLSFQIHFYMF